MSFKPALLRSDAPDASDDGYGASDPSDNKNSPVDEIANVNFCAVHPEDSSIVQ